MSIGISIGFCGIFDAVRIYPISRGKFGQSYFSDISSCAAPFGTRICNIVLLVQLRQKPNQTDYQARTEIGWNLKSVRNYPG